MAVDLKHIITTSVSLLATVLLVVFSARTFRAQHEREVLYPSSALTSVFRLSEINPNLAGMGGDTIVYVYDSGKPGGSVLILGGTHASEIAGCLTVVLMVENLSVDIGRVFLIPYANASGFTHNEPQEAHPQHVVFKTADGPRSFRFGARFTNPVHQWPDPDVYVQPFSGATLAGNETRNLNRSYPGVADGNLTERVAWAITELIRRENIDLSFDLHESSPEYPVVNAIVASEVSQDIASIAVVTLQMDGLNFSLEPSPPNFRGLSHREWADHTNTRPFLLETTSAVMGRLRGRTNAELAISGKDNNYVAAAGKGLLYVPFDSEGVPIEQRIGRHLAAIGAIIDAYNTLVPDRIIKIGGLPDLRALREHGVGYYLASPR
jgi:hypothetical protein